MTDSTEDQQMPTTFREAIFTDFEPTLDQTVAEGLAILSSENYNSGPDYSLERIAADLTARRLVELGGIVQGQLTQLHAEYEEKKRALGRVRTALSDAGLR